VHGILAFFKRLAGHGFQSLHHRFVAWTKPNTTSLLLGTLTDQARSKSELVAENALLRQQVIILRRQVKRPACTKKDRMLLVLLASMVRAWKQALFIVQEDDEAHAGIVRVSNSCGSTSPGQLLSRQGSPRRRWP